MRIEGKYSPEGNISTVDKTTSQGYCINPNNSQDRGEVNFVKEETKAQDKKGEKPSLNDLANAIEKINNTVRIFNRSIHFTKHEESGRLWVKVIDTETEKVVREIPPEEILNILARLDEIIGLLVDERR